MNHRALVLSLIVTFIVVSSAAFAVDLPFTAIEDKSSSCKRGSGSELVTLPDGARISEKIIGLKGLSNAGLVTPVIYRGAQPRPEGYETLKKMGIKTVINLRTSKSEKNAVEAVGMKSIEVPFSVLKDVDAEKVNKVISAMTDLSNQPVYIHCRQGQDRTGIIVAAYRMKVDGWSLKEAEAEMQEFGFNDIWLELKEFIRGYSKSIGK